MTQRIRSLRALFSLLAPLALLAPMHAAAQDPAPQAGPRQLCIMSYNIKHGQTNALCAQPPRIPGQPPRTSITSRTLTPTCPISTAR